MNQWVQSNIILYSPVCMCDQTLKVILTKLNTQAGWRKIFVEFGYCAKSLRPVQNYGYFK